MVAGVSARHGVVKGVLAVLAGCAALDDPFVAG
jgi:hypothetical protein